MNRLRVSNATFPPTLSLVTFIFFDAAAFPIFIHFPQLRFPLVSFNLALQSLGVREEGGREQRDKPSFRLN